MRLCLSPAKRKYGSHPFSLSSHSLPFISLKVNVYMRECISSCIHSSPHTHVHVYVHSFSHSHILISSYIHSLIQSYPHTFILSYIHSLIHSYPHTLMHTRPCGIYSSTYFSAMVAMTIQTDNTTAHSVSPEVVHHVHDAAVLVVGGV